jgi:23S rRNA-/tRNA-specific pseudouridylate synthase
MASKIKVFSNIKSELEHSIKIVFQDTAAIVFMKPQGLSTQEQSGPSLIKSDYLLLPADEIVDHRYRKAVPVHRLDKCTGGLILCSKTIEVERILKQFLRESKIQKRYMAIVRGRVENQSGAINSPISGKESITNYEVISYSKSALYGWITTLNLWPITGRQHQIRRHLREIGHPIIGDTRYWDNKYEDIHNMPDITIPPHLKVTYLWAVELTYPHPITSDIHVNVAIMEPSLYDELRNIENMNWEILNPT